MTRIQGSFWMVTASVFFSTVAMGWMRFPYEDAQVVERADLIVVGRIKQGSVEYVRHRNEPQQGASWEHHAILVIGEVLKGESEASEIPIVIHYGLDPVVGGRVERDTFMMDVRHGDPDYPKDRIAIMDTGNSAVSFEPVVKDAGKDNLWFLRRLGGEYGEEPSADANYGIRDPEDIRPLELKEYYRAYLSDDPEAAVGKQLATNPALQGDDGRWRSPRKRAQGYLDHLEVQRVLEIEDPTGRLERLMPFAFANYHYSGDNIDQYLMDCGDTAGKYFMEHFDDFEKTGHGWFQTRAIQLWGRMGYEPAGPFLLEIFDDPGFRPPSENWRAGVIDAWQDLEYRGCVDRLVRLLEELDSYWAGQEVQKNWWNDQVTSDLTRERRRKYSEVYNAVCALHTIGDPVAVPALEMTKRRWETIPIDNDQIVDTCEKALQRFCSK
jgi:hypothetical protein